MQLVRLTHEEWKQVKNIAIGNKFLHVNLQHSGIPTVSIGEYYQGVLIIKHGRENSSESVQPNLQLDNAVNLQLTNIFNTVPIDSFKAPNKQFLILANTAGILDSLVDRYQAVRDIDKEQIRKMKCFVREFIIF
jgi:hypothetical protein